MTDIVEHLRCPFYGSIEDLRELLNGAAGEIERLRDLEKLRDLGKLRLLGGKIGETYTLKLPSPDDVVEIERRKIVRDEDLKVEVSRRDPPGGQHVGTETGVKVTHLPTGLVAECKTERSQHRNRAIAMDMILGGLTSPHFRG